MSPSAMHLSGATPPINRGGFMQKKGHGAIPDFSRKAPAKKGAAPEAGASKTSAPKPAPIVKPQNTSAKGGRRGG